MYTPITETQVRQMVDSFYGRVRNDALLGPVFEQKVAGRWPMHLDKMVGFWSAALLKTRRYSGNPRAAHAAIPGLAPRHFERWLELFEQTLAEIYDDAQADAILARARTMARALSSGPRPVPRALAMTE